MKISLIVNSEWGVRNFRKNLADSLKRKNFKVTLIFPFAKESEENQFPGFKCKNIYLKPNSNSLITELRTISNLFFLLVKNKPDIVLNFTIKPNLYGSICCQILGIKYINNVTGLGSTFINSNNLTKKLYHIIYRLSFSRASTVFFQNTYDLDYFLSNGICLGSNSSLIPGSGVDLKKFSCDELDLSHKPFIFLMVSRLIKDKGVYELIDAIRIIYQKYSKAEIEFHIVGSIDSNNPNSVSQEDLDQWLLEEVIIYHGHSNNIKKYISKSNCLILPSYREGMPRSILEGFAMKRPAITTNVPGCNNLVENNINGYLCEVYSVTDLANKIDKMYSQDMQKTISMGLEGHKKVTKYFDEKIVIEAYLEKIQKSLEQ